MAGILIIGEHRQGTLRPVTLEVLGAAEQAKQQVGGTIHLALIGQQLDAFVAETSVGGVDEIIRVEAPSDAFDPDLHAAALVSLIDEKQPDLVLLPHSVNSMGYAAAVAAREGYGLATDVFQFGYDNGQLVATRPGYGQKVNVDVDFPGKSVVILTLRPSTYKPASGTASPQVTRQAAPAAPSRCRHLGYVEAEVADTINIPGSEFILSIGRGVGEETNVEEFVELADTVGATLGCSRPIADAGWLPKARQVGQSGKTASSCKLYIAMGISGSVQHLAGMKHVETIIAVNTDREASIFDYAKYGIVGDIFDIAEELRDQLSA